jgi:hypothetical protein
LNIEGVDGLPVVGGCGLLFIEECDRQDMRVRGEAGDGYVWILGDFAGVVGAVEVDYCADSRDGSTAADKIARVFVLLVILRRRLKVVPIYS